MIRAQNQKEVYSSFMLTAASALLMFSMWLFSGIVPLVAGITEEPSTFAVAADNTYGKNIDGSILFGQFENDCFYNTDNNYSQGIKIGWLTSRSREPSPVVNMMKKIMPWEDIQPDSDWYKEFYLAQNMYTPDRLEDYNVVEGEHPYAGITYLEWAWNIMPNDSRQCSLVFDLGIVGPESFAEDTQKAAHQFLGSPYPNGWTNQISTEPLILINYGGKKRAWDWDSHGGSIGSDLILHHGVGVGNFRTYANAGGEVRFGVNLADDFGDLLNRPGRGSLGTGPDSAHSKRPLVYVFTGIDLQGILHDVTLDGGIFNKSVYTVERESFVMNFTAGLAVKFEFFEVILAGFYETKRFADQNEPHQYGSLTFAIPLG